MPVMVSITCKCNIETILYVNQPLHCIWRRWIHADLPIPIYCHKTKGWIDFFVDNCQVQPISLSNRLPIVDTGTAEWIHSHTYLNIPNYIHIDYLTKIAHISIEVIIPMSGAGLKSLFVGNPFYILKAFLEKLVCFRFDPIGDVVICRAAVRGVVLETSVMRWIMRRRDHYSISESCLTS